MLKFQSTEKKTLKSIGNNVKIPTNIAKDSGIRTNHISKVLSELKSKEIVECINEEARKGRLYRLTDTGKEVLESINEKRKKTETALFILPLTITFFFSYVSLKN